MIPLKRLRELCEGASPAPWKHADDISPRLVLYHYDAEERAEKKFNPIGQSYCDTAGRARANMQFICEAREAIPALLSRIELLERLLGEACDIGQRRGAAIEYLCHQVDGYDVIKQVADEIEHGIVDVDGRARIPGAVVQPPSAERLNAIRALGKGDGE